nr:MAG TPA: Terminase large subunit [Caudoviricetes sp.]
MVNLKCRQRGYSFKGASMLVRNYELIPGSKNFAVASE